MIDEKRKNDLRDALLAVGTDQNMANWETNLRLEHAPLCGKTARQLPFYDPDLEQG